MASTRADFCAADRAGANARRRTSKADVGGGESPSADGGDELGIRRQPIDDQRFARQRPLADAGFAILSPFPSSSAVYANGGSELALVEVDGSRV